MTSTRGLLTSIALLGLVYGLNLVSRCEQRGTGADGTIIFRHHKRFLATAIAMTGLTPVLVIAAFGMHLFSKDDTLITLLALTLTMIAGLVMLIEYARFYFKITPEGMECRSLNRRAIPWHAMESVTYMNSRGIGRTPLPVLSGTYCIKGGKEYGKLYFSGIPSASSAFADACKHHLPPERRKYLTRQDIEKCIEDIEIHS